MLAALAQAPVIYGLRHRRPVAWACILCAIGLAACTTLRPIERSELGNLAQRIHEGTRVVVVTADGEREEFRVTAIGDEYIEGATRDGRIVHIEFEEIREIDRRVIAPAKTAGLAGGAGLLYILIVVAVALHAMLVGF